MVVTVEWAKGKSAARDRKLCYDVLSCAVVIDRGKATELVAAGRGWGATGRDCTLASPRYRVSRVQLPYFGTVLVQRVSCPLRRSKSTGLNPIVVGVGTWTFPGRGEGYGRNGGGRGGRYVPQHVLLVVVRSEHSKGVPLFLADHHVYK